MGRDSQHDVVLTHRLRFAMRKLNATDVPDLVINEAVEAITKDRSIMDRVRANREVYDLLRDGYRAEWTDEQGEKRIETLRYLDLSDPANNDLLAVQQMWVKGNLHSRRLDVALFVNGVPLVLMEFKEPNQSVKSAYDDNLTDYRDTIPQLFVPNCLVLLSNGSQARVGATYAPWEFFGDWKVIDATGKRGRVELETALRGTCDPRGAARPVRELRGVHGAPRRADQDPGPVAPVPRRQRRDRQPAPGSGRAGQAARCLLAHPGVGQVAVDVVVHPEGAAPGAGQVDVRDGHRPQGARRPAARRVRRRRRGPARGEGACRVDRAPARAAGS